MDQTTRTAYPIGIPLENREKLDKIIVVELLAQGSDQSIVKSLLKDMRRKKREREKGQKVLEDFRGESDDV